METLNTYNNINFGQGPDSREPRKLFGTFGFEKQASDLETNTFNTWPRHLMKKQKQQNRKKKFVERTQNEG